MILASEALALPTAQLTPEELQAVDRIEAAIEEHIRQHMERRGTEFKGQETRPNVLAEVNQRIKNAGYTTEWQYMFEPHRLNKAIKQLVGFQVGIFPTDDSYRTAARLSLS